MDERSPEESEVLSKLRILYIEDSKDDQIILKRLLERKSRVNFELITANDGVEGLKKLKEEDLDLVILDYKLPGMTGLEFLEKIREMKIATPIIFVTGKGNERIAVEAMKRGARDYIVKDEMDFDRLIKAIEEIALEISLPKNIKMEIVLCLAELFSAHENISIDEIELLLKQRCRSSLEEFILTLEELTKANLLSARPLYSTVACPFCGSLKPSLFFKCPQCGSSQLEKGEALEHMGCGGLELRFNFEENENGLKCPKCGKKVRQLGVDYRKISSLYKCSNGHFFSLPVFNFKCFECERTFDIDEAELKTVLQYRLTRNGKKRFFLISRIGVETQDLGKK